VVFQGAVAGGAIQADLAVQAAQEARGAIRAAGVAAGAGLGPAALEVLAWKPCSAAEMPMRPSLPSAPVSGSAWQAVQATGVPALAWARRLVRFMRSWMRRMFRPVSGLMPALVSLPTLVPPWQEAQPTSSDTGSTTLVRASTVLVAASRASTVTSG
jgi:hypothetical protein